MPPMYRALTHLQLWSQSSFQALKLDAEQPTYLSDKSELPQMLGDSKIPIKNKPTALPLSTSSSPTLFTFFVPPLKLFNPSYRIVRLLSVHNPFNFWVQTIRLC